MSKDERTFIKEGSAIQNLNESRNDASVWIQDRIDKLKSFKQRVDEGRVIMMDGDYSETHPAPYGEQVMYDSISLSIDLWKQNPKSDCKQIKVGGCIPPVETFGG